MVTAATVDLLDIDVKQGSDNQHRLSGWTRSDFKQSSVGDREHFQLRAFLKISQAC